MQGGGCFLMGEVPLYDGWSDERMPILRRSFNLALGWYANTSSSRILQGYCTSLTRTPLPVGPYSSSMPSDLW